MYNVINKLIKLETLYFNTNLVLINIKKVKINKKITKQKCYKKRNHLIHLFLKKYEKKLNLLFKTKLNIYPSI